MQGEPAGGGLGAIIARPSVRPSPARRPDAVETRQSPAPDPGRGVVRPRHGAGLGGGAPGARPGRCDDRVPPRDRAGGARGRDQRLRARSHHRLPRHRSRIGMARRQREHHRARIRRRLRSGDRVRSRTGAPAASGGGALSRLLRYADPGGLRGVRRARRRIAGGGRGGRPETRVRGLLGVPPGGGDIHRPPPTPTGAGRRSSGATARCGGSAPSSSSTSEARRRGSTPTWSCRSTC